MPQQRVRRVGPTKKILALEIGDQNGIKSQPEGKMGDTQTIRDNQSNACNVTEKEVLRRKPGRVHHQIRRLRIGKRKLLR